MLMLWMFSGDVLEIAALREGPRMSFELLAATRTTQQQQQQKGSGRLLSCPQGDEGSSVPLQPALRPPWLRPGAGIEDPAVWSVKKSQQLLGQMLMRAPGAKFPPIWKDLLLMQVGCTLAPSGALMHTCMVLLTRRGFTWQCACQP